MNKCWLFIKQQVPNIIIIAFFLSFGYIWGPHMWADSEINSYNWWFDTYGHMTWGFVFSFIVLYKFRIWAPGTYITAGKIFVILIVVAITTLGQIVIWEGGEWTYDKLRPHYFPNWPEAQKGSEDTTLDNIITAFFALLSMTFWRGGAFIYEKWRPNEARKERIKERRAKAKAWGEETLEEDQLTKKQMWREFKRTVKRKKETLKHKIHKN